MPLIWNHAGRIPGGRVPGAMVSAYDFAPTMLDYLGVPPIQDPALGGASYIPVLQGKKQPWRNTVYGEYQYTRMVRTEEWKYVRRAARGHSSPDAWKSTRQALPAYRAVG